MMIRCPTCGALNHGARRTCEKCGAVLPQTKIRCPNCGTLNPVGHVLCDHCNARLVDPEDVVPSEKPQSDQSEQGPAPVKGISLPTRSQSGEEAPEAPSELPDWLQELQIEAEAPVTSDQKNDLSAEWWQDLHAEEEEDTSEYPDWLSGLLSEETDLGEDDHETIPDIPGWRDVGDQTSVVDDDVPAAEEDVDTGFAPEELPDWFREVATEDNAEDSAVLDAMESFERDASWQLDEEAVDDSDIGLDEVPDWLRVFAEDQGPTDDAEESASVALPSGFYENEAAVAPESETESAAASLPEWLAGAGISEDEVGDDQPTAEASPAFDDAEPPDWLTEAQKSAADDENEEATEQDNGSWWEDLEPAGEAESDSLAEDSVVSGELPDWLVEFAPTDKTEAAFEEDPSGDEDADAPALPAWLTEVSPDEEIPEIPEVAAGLLELPTSDEEMFEDASPPGEPQNPASASDPTVEEEPPTEPSPETEDVPSLPVSSVLDEGDSEPPGVPDMEEEDTFAETASVEDEEVSAPAATDEPVPEWLQNLEVVSPSQPAESEPDASTLARADLPAWLQELAPQEATVAEDAADIASEDLIPADIPDWVQALRPGSRVSDDDTTVESTATAPSESVGPLEGLPGVLASTPMVDMPSDSTGHAGLDVPEDVIEQAQLWQRLLEQPRSAQRPVAQEQAQQSGVSTFVRLLVTVILVLGVAGALLVLPMLFPEGLSLAQPPSQDVALGVSPLVERVDALQLGDRVVIAIEYDPAYAAEMEQIAQPVLEHLAEQGVEAVIVSTVPEGPALGAGLWAEAVGDPTVDMPATYLPGNMQGIAKFLADDEIQTAQHLFILASRSERLRWWIEQNVASDTPLPVSVGMSATAGPWIRPYLEGRGVEGWIVGFPQAMTYRTVRGADAGYDHVMDVLMLAHWAAGALILLGLFYYLVVGKKGRR